MNCVDITLLCVFKKSFSDIYVAFFFEGLQRVSASGRTHIALLRHLRNGPKAYAFAVANRNKKTVNHKFVRRKVFIKDFVRQKKKLTAAIFTHTKPSFQIIRENIFDSENTKKHRSKTPSTIRRKIPVLFGCFSEFFTSCLHLISPQKKCPSIIRRKMHILLMCFQKNI